MMLGRKIREHRPAVILAAIVGLSLISLATGVEATIVHTGIKNAVGIVAYPFLEAKLYAGRAVHYVTGYFLDYYALRKENQALHDELAQVREAQVARNELARQNQRLRDMLNFSREQTRLDLDPVAVIENFKGMLRIDKGSVQGIQPGMPVIAEEGVVGVVMEVTPFSSVVASLHHPKCRIGAMVRRNRLRTYDGVVHAGSDLTSICTMDYIDIKDDVRINDLVVTSPESLFPSGYPIGKVIAVHDTGTLWKSAEIEPAVNPYRVDEAFVIRRAAEEPLELAGAPSYAESANNAPLTPDDRTVQERLAP